MANRPWHPGEGSEERDKCLESLTEAIEQAVASGGLTAFAGGSKPQDADIRQEGLAFEVHRDGRCVPLGK